MGLSMRGAYVKTKLTPSSSCKYYIVKITFTRAVFLKYINEILQKRKTIILNKNVEFLNKQFCIG